MSFVNEMKRTAEELRARCRQLLPEVEAELRDTDRADDEIGRHAEHAQGVLSKDLERRAKKPPTTDDGEAEYLYLRGQQRRARRVVAMAGAAKDRR